MKGQPKAGKSSRPPENVCLPMEPGDENKDIPVRLADAALSPLIRGASTFKTVTAEAFANDGGIEIGALVSALKEQTQAVHGGDLKRAESILLTQAHTLDALFNSLAQRSALNIGHHIGAMETYLRLALKAQSQCRTTLETLAAIKNPPVVFAKQANIAHGHQQVNNGAPASACAAGKALPQTQLLEQTHGERLDTRTAAATSGTDTDLEAVEAVHGAEDSRR